MTDYYPYGMDMPGRSYTAEAYRYGYQGSEKDNGLAGGTGYTTFFRALDPRIGRWMTPDPKVFPWQSPYCSMDCNPVSLVDPLGDKTGDGGNPLSDGGEVTVKGKDMGPHPESKGFEPSTVDTKTLKPTGTEIAGSSVNRYFVKPLVNGLEQAGKTVVTSVVFLLFEAPKIQGQAIGTTIEACEKGLGLETESEKAQKRAEMTKELFPDYTLNDGPLEDWHPEFDIAFSLRLSYNLSYETSTTKAAEVRVKAGNIGNRIGADFEELLVEKLGGTGSFKSGGREFDGAFNNVWYEAKGGNFWNNVALKNVDKWKSSFGHYNSIAKQNGKVFQVYSQKEIPQVFKSYLDKKGIQYFENETK